MQFGNGGTCDCDGESDACGSDDYRFRTNEFLYWRKRGVDELKRHQQYLDSRWCDHAVNYRNGFRFLHGASQQCVWLLSDFCANGRDRECTADHAYRYAERSNDLLCRWKRDLDIEQRREQYVVTGWPNRAFHPGDSEWFLYGCGDQPRLRK